MKPPGRDTDPPDVPLAHSDTRHHMLHKVITEPPHSYAMSLFPGLRPWARYRHAAGEPLSGIERRALHDLVRAGVIETRSGVDLVSPVMTTVARTPRLVPIEPRASDLLAWWDAGHGPAATPSGPGFDHPGTVRRLPDATVAVLRDGSHLGDRAWVVVRATADTPTVLLSDEDVERGTVIGVVPGTLADLMAEVKRRDL